MTKRVISLLLIFVMVTGMVPVFARAENTQTAVDNLDLTVGGTNSFGNLVSQGMSQAMNTVETGNSQAGYSVTDLEIAGSTAIVTYESLEEAVLVVAVYTEDGSRLLTSATQTVSADATEARVALPQITEPYFLAEAFLLDTYDHSPLCESYETPMYTSDMQTLLSSTVDDYDPERVYNLNNDRTTNFAVFAESTLVIKEAAGTNTLISADHTNAIYTFDNADSRITDLQAGTVVAYSYGSNQLLLFKTASVTTEGNTATVTGSQLELGDVFAYMKLENKGDPSTITVDPDTADEGFIYEGMSGGKQSRSWDNSLFSTLSYEYKLDKKFEDKNPDNGVDASLSITGSLKFSVTVELNYYITLARQHIDFKLKFAAAVKAEVNGSLDIDGWTLGTFQYSPVVGILVEFEPQWKFSFSGKVTLEATLTAAIGAAVEHRAGGFLSAQNLGQWPKLECTSQHEGEIFIGVDIHPSLSILTDSVLKAEMTGLVGVKIKAVRTGKGGPKEDPTGNMVHECQWCLDGDISGELKFSIKLKFLNSDDLSFSLKILDTSFKLADFYYSFDHQQWGWNECPHYLFQVRILTLKADGSRAANVPVMVNTGYAIENSNENGLAIGYLPKGNHTFLADIDGRRVAYTKMVTYYCNVTLTANEHYYEAVRDAEKLQVKPDEALATAIVASGNCGKDAKWTLYASGLLKITGSGNMDNYYNASLAPWHHFRDKILSLHVSDSVSNVSQNAFRDCVNLKKAVLDDCVTALGTNAFTNCTGLQEVKLPVDMVTAKCFDGCAGVQKIHYTYGTSGTMVTRATYYTNHNYHQYTLEYWCRSALQTIVFDEGITHLANHAFYDCTALTEAVLPTTLQTIDQAAFYNCTALSKVQGLSDLQTIGYTAFYHCTSLPALDGTMNLKTIGGSAFYGCSALERLVLAEGLESLGQGAFYGCSALKQVHIPTTLTGIPADCFYSCSSLTTLTIPDCVTSLGTNAFSRCSGLLEVTLPVDMVTAKCFDGCAGVQKIHYTYGTSGTMASRATYHTNFNYYQYTLEYWCRSALQTIVFDEGITHLANNAFYDCTALTEAVLPTTLQTIDQAAFYNCTALRKVQGLSDLQTIGYTAFYHCTSLPALDGTMNLKTIGGSAFSGCSALERLVLAEGLESLGQGAFYGCSALKQIHIPTTLTAIPASCFYNCSSLTKLTIPDCVTSLGTNAFYGCSGLLEVTLPVDMVTAKCFDGCSKVQKIHYTYGTSGTMATRATYYTNFNYYQYTLEYWCRSALQTVVFDEGSTHLANHAFFDCSVLTEAVLPSTLQTIDQCAFYNCTALNKVQGLSNLETIGYCAFYNCTSLPALDGTLNLKTIGGSAFCGCSALERLDLAEGLESLGQNAFYGCKTLKQIYIPTTLTSIPNDSFRNCCSLTSIIIPDSVTYLGTGAFTGCSGLLEVTLPVDLINVKRFDGCNKVQKIHYTYGTTGQMFKRESYYTYDNYYQNTLEYHSRSALTQIVFDEGITLLANHAFFDCSALTEAMLPSTLLKIDESAFYNCTALNNVQGLSDLETLGPCAFYNCTSLSALDGTLNLKTIGSSAFCGCSALERLDLAEGLESLGQGAFYGCSALKQIHIPTTLTSIPNDSFRNCSSLASIIIPDSVTYLGTGAFTGCSGLLEVTLPVDLTNVKRFDGCNKVQKIHYTYGTTGQMFKRESYYTYDNYYQNTLEYLSRSALTEVVFDPDVTSIANLAFYQVSNLTTVKLTGDCPAVGNMAFSGSTATIYYPLGNLTYTDEAKAAFGNTVSWVSYVPEEPEEVTQTVALPTGDKVVEQIPTVDAVYEGDTQTEMTEDAIYQTSSFDGLVPNEQYVMLAVVSLDAQDLLAADNLLFIDQAAADEKGTLSFRYVQRVPVDEYYVFVCGASDKKLQDTTITVPELTSNGQAQALSLTVTDGDQTLIEGIHYVIAEGAVFTDSGTYTATLRGIRQYSGLVTVEYVVAEPSTVIQPVLTLKSPALEFKDMIKVVAFFTADHTEDVVEMGMITYKNQVDTVDIATADHVIPGAEYEANSGRYFSGSQGIHAKYLGDTVYLACYAKLKDGSYVYTKLAPYSPITYATNQLEKSTDMKLKQLCAAMLNYGAAAQNYFLHNTDNLANSTLTDEQKTLSEAYRSDMVTAVPTVAANKQGVFVNNQGFRSRRPAVSFEGAFSINYFFTPQYAPVGEITMYYWTEADFAAAEVLTVENASGFITMDGTGTQQYRGDLTGISAKDLSSAVYVAAIYSDGTNTWTSGVLGYSIGAYCSSMAKGTDAMTELAKATAVYGYHAKQYFG